MTIADRLLADLEALVAHGPRFHGTPGIAAAADWLESELAAVGLATARQSVTARGFDPGTVRTVAVSTPIGRDLPAWPMLSSPGSGGPVTGTVQELGPEGLWGDSIVWLRFAVCGPDGTALAYLHARDRGPAAPQPLPAGSHPDVPHLAIGHLDGRQLSEWLADGIRVTVTVELDSAVAEERTADNLVVDIAGTGPGLAIVCAHYDSFYNTVGAYDNGSGTIALLELARRFAAEAPARSLRLVFFTGEEWHLLGSRHYVAQLSPEELDGIDFALNLDGLGRGDFLEAFAGPEAFGFDFRTAVLDHAAATGRDLRLASRFPPTKGTDDASFHAAGVPTAFVTFNDLNRLHQPEDTPNPGIAANIAWTVPLAHAVAERMPRPARAGKPGLL